MSDVPDFVKMMRQMLRNAGLSIRGSVRSLIKRYNDNEDATQELPVRLAMPLEITRPYRGIYITRTWFPGHWTDGRIGLLYDDDGIAIGKMYSPDSCTCVPTKDSCIKGCYAALSKADIRWCEENNVKYVE